ncbi:MAG TPA: GGDEF domain-containing protein, partial [Nevskiaceae bacterium]|nr:GGDEF domain-containing protein [Nevskiaceae bacterium]
INDRHGHEAGDGFLRQMAHRLEGSVRSNEFVGRYGGDEFVVIAGPGEAGPFGQRIEAVTAGRFELVKDVVIDYPGASVGVAVFSPEDASVESLLKRADAAMYACKLARKGQRSPGTALH